MTDARESLFAARSRSCSLPGCTIAPTIHHAVRPSYMSDFDARKATNASKIRHYDMCEKHDAEFFGDGGFLRVDLCERIAKELRVAD